MVGGLQDVAVVALLSPCQLHHLVSDDVCLKVVELYLNEQQRGAAGGNLSSRCVRAARETSYQWKAERCMADENCFKVRGLCGGLGLKARPLGEDWTLSRMPGALSSHLWARNGGSACWVPTGQCQDLEGC